MKRSIKVTLACIPLVAVPITHVSGISNKNINKKITNENNYEEIANQVRNKLNVQNWIKDVHNKGFQNYDNDVKSLYNLELNNIQKEFLKQNLQEKYQVRNMNNSKRKRVRRKLNAEDWGWRGPTLPPLKMPNGSNLIDLNGEKIYFRGPNYNKPSWETHDFPFKDDVSYLNWNNQTIVNNMIVSGLKGINFKKRFDKIQKNIDDYVEFRKNNENYFLKLENKNTSTFEIVLIKLHLVAKLAEKTKQIKTEDAFIYSLKIVEWTKENFLEKQFEKMKKLFKEFEGLSNYVGINLKNTFKNDNINKKTKKIVQKLEVEFAKNNGISEDLIKKTIDTDLFATLEMSAPIMLGLRILMTKLIKDYFIANAGILFKTTLSTSIIAGFKAIVITTLASVLVVSVFCAIDLLLNPGNGYTMFDNANDHGLNDWNFQYVNNFQTLALLAKEWSNNYEYPITWKVTDGWFSTPTLKISRGTIRYKGGPDGNWTKLTPFNWGDKTHFKSYTN